MSHPYRTPPNADDSGNELARDDSVLGVMLLVLGGFRVAVAIALGEIWRAEATIAMVMIVFGLGLLLPRKRPLLDVFYVAIFLVLFMLALGVAGLLERM